MNKNNNIFNKNEIENKLKDFKEGQDYSISPTDEPNLKTYNFHNDKLRSMFVSDKVPVKIAREAYDDKNYTYRGHFEEGKDYYYSHQTWEGNPPTDENGWKTFSKTMWKGSNGDYTNGSIRGRRLGNSSEPKKIESGYDLNSHPVGCCPCGFKDIRLSDKYCQKCGAKLCDKAKKTAKSDLAQENQELKQQLAEVQKQLAEVLAELKKLKSSSEGQNNEKLDQQITQNEKLIENGEKVSQAEVKEQVQKSQALLKEANVSTSPAKGSQKDNSSGSLPYVIGGSVVVIGILASWLLMRKKAKN